MVRLQLLVLLFAACQSSMAETPRPDPVKPPKKDDQFERAMMLRFHMYQNFDLLRAIERLLVKGKLEEAKSFANSIAQAPEIPAHGSWTSHVIEVRDRAAVLGRATTLTDAVHKVARLGAACGNCHGDVGVSPQFRNPPRLSPDQSTIEARMVRHRWAADRIWEGIVGNEDSAWNEGLTAFATTPIDDPSDRVGLGRRLQRLADQARRPGPGRMTDRATTYGEILELCVSCHAKR
jgi:cytochrome c553